MASSVSGQDEPNHALWLATWAGKMEPSCPLGTACCIPQAKFHQKSYNKSFIDQVCSVKWLDIGLILFLRVYFVSVHKHAKKELGQYPAILTSCLVNNPHVIDTYNTHMLRLFVRCLFKSTFMAVLMLISLGGWGRDHYTCRTHAMYIM